LIGVLLIFRVANAGGVSNKTTVLEYWIGPGNYDCILTNLDISALGTNDTAKSKFAITTNGPNYKTISVLLLSALVTRNKISLYGAGKQC
jgi:hypothetical protein